MPDQKPTLDYYPEPLQVLRGNTWRAFRTVGGVSAGGMTALAVGLWAIARDSFRVKVAATLLMFGVALIAACAVSIAARFAIARVQNGRLTFSFCGVRTRIIPLDSATTFQIRRIGRLRVLVIISGEKRYVPNGAFDRGAIVKLLRLNGVVENP